MNKYIIENDSLTKSLFSILNAQWKQPNQKWCLVFRFRRPAAPLHMSITLKLSWLWTINFSIYFNLFPIAYILSSDCAYRSFVMATVNQSLTPSKYSFSRLSFCKFCKFCIQHSSILICLVSVLLTRWKTFIRDTSLLIAFMYRWRCIACFVVLGRASIPLNYSIFNCIVI